MSEFTTRQPLRHPLTLPLLSFRIPFGKVVPTDDDLFLPIHPPTDAIVPQTNDAQEGGDDANTDAASGDGSDATEESDEVSFSLLHKMFFP